MEPSPLFPVVAPASSAGGAPSLLGETILYN